MNSTAITEIVFAGMGWRGGHESGGAWRLSSGVPAAVAAARDLVRIIIDQVIGAVPADTGPLENLWLARAALATSGQWLIQAMTPLWEREAEAGQDVPAAVSVFRRAFQRLEAADGVQPEIGNKNRVVARLLNLTQEIMDSFSTSGGQNEDAVRMGAAVRGAMMETALLLGTSSTILWQRAADLPLADGRPTDTGVVVDQDATKDYLDALVSLAAALRRIAPDPASIPFGRDAVAEVEALCIVRAFILKRYREVRRWVCPTAPFDPDDPDPARRGADRGEQLILHYQEAESGRARDPGNWTWRGNDTAEYIIGDMLCDLMHAADALGIDFDQALASGERHYLDEKMETDVLTA